MENNFSFKTRIQVRYAETDAMGVVHHATYPIWFEQARVDFFRAVGAPYDEVEREGFASPVLELNVQYKRPCRFGDFVDVETKLVHEGRCKYKFLYQVTLNGELCTTGYSVHVFTKGGIPTREKPECIKKVEDKIFSD